MSTSMHPKEAPTPFSVSADAPPQLRDRNIIGTVQVPNEERHKLAGVKNPYAMVLEGDCMHPAVFAGDKAVCDPDGSPEPGEMVIIYPKDGSQAIAKQLVAITSDGVVVQMLKPLRRGIVPRGEIAAIHRVLFVVPPAGVRREVSLGPLIEQLPGAELLLREIAKESIPR